MEPTVIGIDPSLTSTGLAWADGHTQVIDFSRGTLRLITGDHRLLAIANTVRGMVWGNLRLHAVIEDLPTHAHGSGLTGKVQGVVRLVMLEAEIPYITVVPGSLKVFATGVGKGPKANMRVELLKRTGLDLEDDNECDAWWLRELGLHKLGYPTLDLPKTHTRALEKIEDWR